ncbi:hypothetical protein OE88DRAFT_224002 [Heliocybe sulcata]|uniref:Uncharacterized protein n=1 Tax=Heliocybe sulcata TaxID=5364 RepID=A0A5C3N3Y8_9AGAM|nr:hypothetical protein OE88DRAFT_224002 [Heliocybe sulcata]
MESMVDFGLEGVGEDGDAGVTAVEAEEAVERATLASLEGVLDTQNAEVVGPAEASGSAETSEESMLIVAAELEVEEEPQRAGVTGETGLEYGVEEEEEDAEGEVDELDDEDVVSVSASEYAVRRSQTREYTVEEARSERIWSQVPEESILADETANEVVEKVPEETADVDEAESKIPSQGTTQETLVAEDQVDFDGIISEKAVNEAVVQELNAAVAETTPLVDGEADNEMMVVIQETEVEQAQALEKVPGLVSDRTEETSSVEVAEYGSGASQLHEDPEMPVVEEPFSAAQPELVVSAEAASPSGLLDGVLPPIMANSEVPDPASVGHTPGATTPVASLMPFIVGRTFSDTGLFTPFGEGSGVTTPEPERDDEILQVPAQPDAMEPPEATVEQVDSDEVVEEVLLEDAISAEEAPQDEEPATKERVPAVVVEEPTSNPAALEELTPDVAEADTSIEHSDVQSVDLHPPSQPLLHPDPYPYSLSTPVGETLTSGLFDLQPEAPATNMSSEVLDILGQDLDLDDLELTYPEARSLSPEADRRIPVEPAFEAPVYRYPPLSIEDMPHLRLVHDGHTQPGVVSPRLGSEQLAHPGMPVAPGALAEEEEEDMPRPEEEEESGPEESQVTHSVPPLPMESDERDNLSKSSQPPQETGSSQAHPENGASEEAHAPVPVSSVSEEGATPGATQGAPQDSKKGIINGSDEAAPSLKRKRDSLPHLQLPDNTGNSKTSATDANETPAPAGKKSRKIRGKPKKKIFVKPKAEVVSDAGSSSSAASVAAQILASSSRVPSRSSSVASEPSPTAQKPSGLKIHIRPLRLENDRVFHHHGRKPRFPTPLPTLTRSRPKVQRQRKSIRPSKAEVEPEIKDTQERNVTPEPEVTREAEVPTPTESVPTAEAAPEAGSSLTPKPEYKSELAQDSHREQASEIEPSSLPPAPPTSPVKLAPSQSTVARTESTPQTPSLKSPRESQTQYSSPVTRSHCLYHVISIPREDNGPRITFMVPGCSLLDQDLINGEDIVDVREATREDERRAVDDIETLGFDEGLLVVLKALVNGDHQSIFYLPASSEDPSALNNNRRRLSAASTSKPGSNQTTPVSTRRKRLPANKTSIDRKGISRTSEAAPQSASVNGTVVGSRDGSPADTAESKQDASSSDSRETDSFGEDDFDQSRLPPKRRKYMSHEGSMTSRPQEIAESDERPSASGSNNPEGGEAPLKSVPAHRLRPRRSKRLSADASAYKPEDNSSHEESADDEERLTARRMKRKPSGGKRGTKRGREVTNGVEASGDRDVKRSRVEENVSSGNSGNARASNPIS